MNLRKKVFVDLNSEQRDIIISVLDKYCVPYDIKTNQINCIFGYIETYDISVELSVDEKDGTSPYDFIIGKVNERLQLEESFNGPCMEHPEKEPSLFEEIFQPDSGVKMSKTLNQSDNKKSLLNLIGLKDKLNHVLNKYLKHEDDLQEKFERIQDHLPDGLTDFITELEQKGMVQMQEIPFNKLPKRLQDVLAEKIPIEKLKSDKCHIRQGLTGFYIEIER